MRQKRRYVASKQMFRSGLGSTSDLALSDSRVSRNAYACDAKRAECDGLRMSTKLRWADERFPVSSPGEAGRDVTELEGVNSDCAWS